MVLTINRIKYLLEQDRIGREKRGGRDYLDEATLKVFAECREIMHRQVTDPQPAPFHLKKKT